MAFRFLRNRVSGSDDPDGSPDLRGPLDLGIGDRVEYYQRAFTVTGILLLSEKKERRTQYHVREDGGGLWILEAERDRELVLSLQRLLDPGVLPTGDEAGVVWEDRLLSPVNEGSAAATSLGEIPPGKVRKVRYREYMDENEEALLVVEWWAHHVEVRSGEFIHEGELTIHHADEEEFDPKPPPRIDVQALAAARRVMEEAGLPPRKRPATAPGLEEARRKLASLGKEPAPGE